MVSFPGKTDGKDPGSQTSGSEVNSTDKSPGEGFLSRWSQRKNSSQPSPQSRLEPESAIVEPEPGDQQLAEQADADAAKPIAPIPEPEISELDAEETETRVEEATESELVLTDEDMPPLDSLHAESDFSPFFNSGVSKELRQQALRHLFRMPKFNIRDGLNDYDEDYTYFEPLGDTVTCDMKFHAARKERERLEKLKQQELEELELQQQRLEETDTSPDEESAQASNEQASEESTQQSTDSSSETSDAEQDAVEAQAEEHEAMQRDKEQIEERESPEERELLEESGTIEESSDKSEPLHAEAVETEEPEMKTTRTEPG